MARKSILGFMLVAVLFAASAVTAYAATPTRVQLDGVFLEVDAVIVDSRTLAPARAIVEAMGGSVGWDGDLRQVTITHGNINILLTIDNPTAYVNGAAVVLDVPPQIINSLTKIPVRFVGESLGVDVSFHPDGFVVINTALGFGGTPPTVAAPPAAVTQPAPPASFASFQQILDTYTQRLREATPRLLDDFRAAAVGVTDISALAEISIEITAALAEISVEGTAEMANLWIVRGVGSEAVYMDYAARLNAVYTEEAARISALYMELAMGGGQPATASPLPGTVPAAQTFGIGDTIQLPNATITISRVSTSESVQFEGQGGFFPFDGHFFFGVHFDVVAYSMDRHTFFSPATFITEVTYASGRINYMPSAFGDHDVAPFFANTQRSVAAYFHVPHGETVVSITVSDGIGGQVTVNVTQ